MEIIRMWRAFDKIEYFWYKKNREHAKQPEKALEAFRGTISTKSNINLKKTLKLGI